MEGREARKQERNKENLGYMMAKSSKGTVVLIFQ